MEIWYKPLKGMEHFLQLDVSTEKLELLDLVRVLAKSCLVIRIKQFMNQISAFGHLYMVRILRKLFEAAL